MFYPALIATFCMAMPLTKTPYFAAEIIDDQISLARGMAIGDVDGDGRPDILLADNTEVVWYRNGDWKRFVLIDNLPGDHPVSIAARDLDGDGIVEVAVGTRGDAKKTADTRKPGSVYYLIRPDDPTQRWAPVKLGNEAVLHMQWVSVGKDSHQLVVLPQRAEEGAAQEANILTYEKRGNPALPWKHRVVQQPMPMAHHLHVHNDGDSEVVYISGDSGVMGFSFKNGRWIRNTADWLARGRPLNEMHMGQVASRNARVFAAIEPFQGNMLTVYTPGLSDSLLVYDKIKRVILERKMEGGHGLGMTDFLGLGRDQVVSGWRKPNEDGDFGIKLYVPFNPYWEAVDVYWVDRGGIACEDLRIADIDGDGRPDIVAFGGSTNNLKIYWNRTE